MPRSNVGSGLRERYAEFVVYETLQFGFDTARVMKWFYLGFGGLTSLAVFMMANWYIVFTAAEIQINSFWGLREHRFAYGDVVDIKTAPAFIAPNGNTVHRRQFVLRFSDSTSWSTRWDPSDAQQASIGIVINAVSERSGIQISEIPILGRQDLN